MHLEWHEELEVQLKKTDSSCVNIIGAHFPGSLRNTDPLLCIFHNGGEERLK